MARGLSKVFVTVVVFSIFAGVFLGFSSSGIFSPVSEVPEVNRSVEQGFSLGGFSGSLDLASSSGVRGQLRGLASVNSSLYYISWDFSCVRSVGGKGVHCFDKKDNTGGLAFFNGSFWLPLNSWERTSSLVEVTKGGVERHEFDVSFLAVASSEERLFLFNREKIFVYNEDLERVNTVMLPDLEGRPYGFCRMNDLFFIPGYTEQKVNIVDSDGDFVVAPEVGSLSQPLGCAFDSSSRSLWLYGNRGSQIFRYGR